MILETWSEVLSYSFQQLWVGIVQDFLPEFLAALIIFVLGWIVGVLLGRVAEQVIKSLRLDNALKTAGAEDLISRAGFSLDSGRFIGGLVKWFIIIAFLVASLDVLGLTQVNSFLREVVLDYLPQVFVAVFIILVAAVLADVLQHLVSGTAKAAGISSARLLGTITKWSIWIFAVLAALFQLGIAPIFMQTLFTGVVVALSIGFGLAFGLGGQDAAKGYLEHVRKEIKRD